MITCIPQRKWNYIFLCSVQKPPLDIVFKNVEYGSTIFIDEYRSYDKLEEHTWFYTQKSNPFTERIYKWHCICE